MTFTRIVFFSDVNNCFFEGPNNSTRLHVSIMADDCLGYSIAAEVVNTESDCADGWYAFLEGYACNRNLFENMGYPVPAGMRFDVGNYSWSFDSLELATLWAKVWASVGCGAKYSHTERNVEDLSYLEDNTHDSIKAGHPDYVSN